MESMPIWHSLFLLELIYFSLRCPSYWNIIFESHKNLVDKVHCLRNPFYCACPSPRTRDTISLLRIKATTMTMSTLTACWYRPFLLHCFLWTFQSSTWHARLQYFIWRHRLHVINPSVWLDSSRRVFSNTKQLAHISPMLRAVRSFL